MTPDTGVDQRLGPRSASNRLMRASLGRQVAKALRNDILFGHLPAGQILSQEQVCAQFQTSRMPVRDAFRQLLHEGFLLPTKGNQVRVAAFTEVDIEDMFYIEATLHSLATKRATERAAESELEKLADLHEQMMACSAERDVRTMSDLNRLWHQRINYLATSPKLLAALRAVSLNILDVFLLEHPEWIERSNREHAKIMEAMKRRDGESAEQTMFGHVKASGEATALDLQRRLLSNPHAPRA